MQLFDFLMLVLEQPYASGLTLPVLCALLATVTLAFLSRFRRPNHLRRCRAKPRHRLDDPLLRDLRTACRDFDREVRSWEFAAQQQGGRL